MYHRLGIAPHWSIHAVCKNFDFWSSKWETCWSFALPNGKHNSMAFSWLLDRQYLNICTSAVWQLDSRLWPSPLGVCLGQYWCRLHTSARTVPAGRHSSASGDGHRGISPPSQSAWTGQHPPRKKTEQGKFYLKSEIKISYETDKCIKIITCTCLIS